MTETLENTIKDMVSDLLYYDRKEDEDLPVGAIEKMITDGELTQAEIVERFQEELDKAIPQ